MIKSLLGHPVQFMHLIVYIGIILFFFIFYYNHKILSELKKQAPKRYKKLLSFSFLSYNFMKTNYLYAYTFNKWDMNIKSINKLKKTNRVFLSIFIGQILLFLSYLLLSVIFT